MMILLSLVSLKYNFLLKKMNYKRYIIIMSSQSLINPNEYIKPLNLNKNLNLTLTLTLDQETSKKTCNPSPSQSRRLSSGSLDSYDSHNDPVRFTRLRGFYMFTSYAAFSIKNKLRPNKKFNLSKRIRNFIDNFKN